MALQRLDSNALRRSFKRRRKNMRRARRMERAVRWNLYMRPVADIVRAVTRIFR